MNASDNHDRFLLFPPGDPDPLEVAPDALRPLLPSPEPSPNYFPLCLAADLLNTDPPLTLLVTSSSSRDSCIERRLEITVFDFQTASTLHFLPLLIESLQCILSQHLPNRARALDDCWWLILTGVPEHRELHL
jgi:hypothetical protein